jgi:hypothetical protein
MHFATLRPESLYFLGCSDRFEFSLALIRNRQPEESDLFLCRCLFNGKDRTQPMIRDEEDMAKASATNTAKAHKTGYDCYCEEGSRTCREESGRSDAVEADQRFFHAGIADRKSRRACRR